MRPAIWTGIGLIPFNTEVLGVRVARVVKATKPVSSTMILEALDLLPPTVLQPDHPYILL